MTKIVKFWQQFSFWLKLKATFATFGVGGEIALFVGESHEKYKWLVGGATVLSILITNFIEDKNNDGIVDIFQKKDNGK